MKDATKILWATLIVGLLITIWMIWSGPEPRTMSAYMTADNGDRFIVSSDMEDRPEAVNALSNINRQMTSLMSYLKAVHPRDKVTLNLLSRFNPDRLAEITPINAFGYTSYTADHGNTMRLCLRDKKTFSIHEIHDLTFVAFHELAHIADWESNHNLPFWEVFKYLLIQAKVAGIYQPRDYSRRPMKYCGMMVSYNPFFDDALVAYQPRD